ncbi:hypothetical protein ACFL4W_03435 [Planctomycetota bacterium]
MVEIRFSVRIRTILLILLILSITPNFLPAMPMEARPTGPLEWLSTWLDETEAQAFVFYEVGERSSLDDFEDNSIDSDYDYHKEQVKWSQQLNKAFHYSLGYLTMDKDYDTQDSMDNTSETKRGGMDLLFWKRHDNTLTFSLDLIETVKEFDDTPANSYRRVKIAPGVTWRRKNDETARLITGVDRYIYSADHTKDQLKPFARAEYWTYVLDRKLKVLGSYAIHNIQEEQKGRDRVQRDLRAGADYKFDSVAIYKLMARFGWGNRDTRMDGDIDEDYDYDYTYAYVKSEHKFSGLLRTRVKFQMFRKDYDTASLDHDGFFVQNEWDLQLRNEKDFKVFLAIDGEFKKTDHENTSASYEKSVLKTFGTIRSPKNYDLSAGLQYNVYDYEGPGDKQRYYAILSGEKTFPELDMTLSLDLKYRLTDNEDSDDSDKASFRLSIHQKF